MLIERFDTWTCESPSCEDMRVAWPTIHATNPSCKRSRGVVPPAAGPPRDWSRYLTGPVPLPQMCVSRANQAFTENSIFRVFGISVR